MPRSKKTKQYTQMILKLAEAVRAAPYCKIDAGNALESWVTEVNIMEPALDVSYCKVVIGLYGVAPLPQSEQLEAAVGENAAVGLEPAMGKVTVKVQHRKGPAKPSGPQQPESKPTKKASFVYPMATALVKDHGISFEEGVKRAEQCWKRCPRNMQRHLFDEAGGGGDARAVEALDDGPSDTEPLLDLEREPGRA